MVIVDYNLKMQDIIKDFHKAIAKFNLAASAYEKKEYIINPTDDEETKEYKEALKEEILTDLGRSAELFFKYIVKIARMKLFPNEHYENTVDSHGQNVKGFKEKETLTKSVLNEMCTRLGFPISIVDNITSVSGIGPKAHDFNYLFRIIENLFPSACTSYKRFIELRFKSMIVRKNLELKDDNDYSHEKKAFTTFPEGFEDIIYFKDEDEESRVLLEKINSRISTIDYSGDIFTRLRYFSNNPNDKTFDIDKIFEMISELKMFCSAIHYSKENLDLDPKFLFANYMLNENKDYCRFSHDELLKLINHDVVKRYPNIFMNSVFYSNLSIDEILDLLNLDPKYFSNSEWSVDDNYNICIMSDINKKTLLYFYDLGITSIEEIEFLLTDRSKPFFVDAKYSIEEFDRLRRVLCGGTNDFSNLKLLRIMNEYCIEALLDYPEILNFFKTQFINPNDMFQTFYDDLGFFIMLSNEDVVNNPESFYGLDSDQISIYENFCKIFEDIDRVSRFFTYTFKQDVRERYGAINYFMSENIKRFSYNKVLFHIIPLQLNPDNNELILSELIKEGLDLDNIKTFDTTIFFIPPYYLYQLIVKLEAKGQKLIVNNDVNPEIYNVLESLMREKGSKRSIIKREKNVEREMGITHESNVDLEELRKSDFDFSSGSGPKQ